MVFNSLCWRGFSTLKSCVPVCCDFFFRSSLLPIAFITFKSCTGRWIHCSWIFFVIAYRFYNIQVLHRQMDSLLVDLLSCKVQALADHLWLYRSIDRSIALDLFGGVASRYHVPASMLPLRRLEIEELWLLRFIIWCSYRAYACGSIGGATLPTWSGLTDRVYYT
jgi:hypothetical protein